MYKRRPIIKHNNILRERTSSFSRPIYIYERARTDETVAAVSPAHYILNGLGGDILRARTRVISATRQGHTALAGRSVFFGRAPSKTRFVFEINFFFLRRFPLSSSAFLFLRRIRVRFFLRAQRVPRTRFPPIFCHRVVKRFFRFRGRLAAYAYIILLIVTTHPSAGDEGLGSLRTSRSAVFSKNKTTRVHRGHDARHERRALFNVIPTSRKRSGCTIQITMYNVSYYMQ